jgi:hypothetical protein
VKNSNDKEVTKNMQMLHMICQRLGLEKPQRDQEVKEMTQATPVTAMVNEIKKARALGERMGEEIDQAQKPK